MLNNKLNKVFQNFLRDITNKEKTKKDNNVFEVTRSDVNIWTTNDQSTSLYKFGIPGEELSERKM